MADTTEQTLYTVLTGATTITAHVSTRVYPLVLPQRSAFPALAYERITSGVENTLDGYASMLNPHIVIDIYANTYAESKEIAGHIHTTINASTAIKGIMVGQDDFTELMENNDLKYRVQQEFSFWVHT